MVDDLLIPLKCNNDSILANAKLNSFMERKKLKLSDTKCSKMHLGKPNENCPNLSVHCAEMKSPKKNI